jgi:hypothetical protein
MGAWQRVRNATSCVQPCHAVTVSAPKTRDMHEWTHAGEKTRSKEREVTGEGTGRWGREKEGGDGCGWETGSGTPSV